jgi:predicted RND superfamily exporter protein
MISPTAIHRVVVGCFAALARYSIQHPKRIVILALALTCAIAPGALKLKLRTDGHALVDPKAPQVHYDRLIRDEFGIQDPVVVLIQPTHADGIYNPATLQMVRNLTADFTQLEGVDSNKVVSLATQRGFRNRPATLHFQTLLENPRRTPAQLAELRDDLRRIELYTGTIVSFDGRSTAIMIGARDGIDRTELYQRVRDVLERHADPENPVGITGPPVAEALLGTHILEDLGVPAALLGTTTRVKEETSGFPASLYELRRFIGHRIGLVPVAMLVMVLIFFVSFRRMIAAILPMAEVGACLAFVFGLMGLCGVPVYLTIAVMPVLLVAMAVTDEIHVYSRYFALLHAQPAAPHRESLQRAMDEMVCPVVNTSLTTAIGFVSFAFSPLPPVQAFGIFTAIGILFCLFWSLLVLPALLAIISPRWVMTRRAQERELQTASTSFDQTGMKRTEVRAPFEKFAFWAVRRRWWIVGSVAVLVALTPFGLRRLTIQDSWIDGFERDSEFSRATRLVNERYHGMHLLNVSVDAGEILRGTVPGTNVAFARISLPGNVTTNPASLAGRWLYLSADDGTNAGSWRSSIESATRSADRISIVTQQRESNSVVWLARPNAKELRYEIISQPHLQQPVLQEIADLAAFIEPRRDCKVGKVLSAPDYVATTRFMVRPNEPGSRFVPTNSAEIKLMWDYYRIVRGAELLREAVDTNYARSLLTVFLKEANFVDTARLLKDIRAYEREHLAPKNIRLDFAGDVAVSQSLIGGIVSTQTQSLLGSLVGIYLVTALLGRSWRWGLYAVIPCALSILFNFAAMGWLGIPLGVATSMFAAMTLGNGVDFAIHVLEGFNSARAQGKSPDAALATSLARTGPAVVVNTLAIALGFGVLMLSQVPANARLGALIILGVVNCLLASLLLLPALLHWWPLHGTAESRSQSMPAPASVAAQS